jgi:hypothetical protein
LFKNGRQVFGVKARRRVKAQISFPFPDYVPQGFSNIYEGLLVQRSDESQGTVPEKQKCVSGFGVQGKDEIYR